MGVVPAVWATWLGMIGIGRDRVAPVVEPVDDPTGRAVSDALTLHSGATCLEHDRLADEVTRRLEYGKLDPRMSIVVEGDPLEVGSLRFTLRDQGTVIAEREHRLGPAPCDSIYSVVSLSIAMALDATVLRVGASPEPPEAERSLAPEPSPSQSEAPSAADKRPIRAPRSNPEPVDEREAEVLPSPWEWRLRGAALMTTVMPSLWGGGGELGVELGWRRRLDLRVDVAVTTGGITFDDRSTIDVTLFMARLRVCTGSTVPTRLRPRVCAGALGGSTLARGDGFEVDSQAIIPWLAMDFGGGLWLMVSSHLALSLDLSGAITAIRPVFTVNEGTQERERYDFPRFGASLATGLVVVFGEGRRGARP